MRLINVQAFLERESLIRERKPVDRRITVLEFGDDQATEYAILSHRWMAQEVSYTEMVKLAKMTVEERDEIRQRDGYQKIIQSCEQARKDRYQWLWVDTCCIDKQSSTELSEAINSMYRWYENAQVCYAYLHDVPGSSVPPAGDEKRYPHFRGWPEWFSRGWMLQELIAPSNLQFFNKDWQGIGEKRTLAPTLPYITGIPEHILTHGLFGNRPCVAQIMSWAARRTTTRVEDRAYSLMGHDEFSQFIKKDVPDEELDSIEDRLDSFPITNRGIQIWMLLRPFSCTLFRAWLPCRRSLRDPPVVIDLAFWESNYYRWQVPFHLVPPPVGPPQFRQVYLRYQDLPHRNTTFEIDDSALTENGLTCCDVYPNKFSRNTITLTNIDSHCIKVYSGDLPNHRFVVGFGQCFGKDWIAVSDESKISPRVSWEGYAAHKYFEILLVGAPKYTQHMNKTRSGSERSDAQVCILQIRLPQTTRILQIASVMWKGSRMCGVKFDVFHDTGFSDVSGEWTAFDVAETDNHGCDWRGLMILDQQRKYGSYEVGGVRGNFSAAPDGIKLGDYGHFTDSKEFCCEGNLFADLEPLSLMADITKRQHRVSLMDCVMAWDLANNRHLSLNQPLMLSLSSNNDLKSLLASFPTRLTNRYLVTRTIQCPPDPFQPGSTITTPLYSAAKPFVWHRSKGAGSVSEERSLPRRRVVR